MESENSSSSQCSALASDEYEKTSPSNSGAGVDVPAIFLSHSGRQKSFVEHLYNALKSAEHMAFFDKHSLPKGSPFPGHIEQVARGCRLGVVVLSDDFLTSKWPMLELEMLVLQRGPDAMVLPLFYKLHPQDLKAPTNLSKWRSVWKEKGGEHADQWDKAVQALDSFNGEVFVQGTSEITYINKVVHRICTLVPCNVPFSLSFVQGHQRLVEEISRMFEQAKERNREQSSCMIGLHGVGGLGKTTLCMSMVNFYTTQYHGRSCLIEFPSDGDKSKIVQECQRALHKLTNLSNELLLNKASNFDQVIHLMEKHMSGYDVFLAIDNVWESSREEAEKLLRVRFSGTSKVLLTSRSEQLLQDLLAGHTHTSYISPLPAPEYEEAFQIFQKYVKLSDLRSLVDENQIDRVLKRCRFNGVYHALALKALAQHVRSECALIDSGKLKDQLSVILKEISNSDLESVEKVIMLSHKSLPLPKKHMFLDIAHLTIMKNNILICNKNATYEPHLWLCRLYKELPKSKINKLIYELALDGLIQTGVDAFGEKMVGVHDVFLDLAQTEAANSPRFFMETSLTKSVENTEWERLERVLLLGPHKDNENLWQQECRGLQVSRFLDKLQQQECPELQVLVVSKGRIRSPIHLDYMPSLRVLLLHEIEFSHGVLAAKRVEFKSGAKRSLVSKMMRSGVQKQNGPCQLQVLSVQSCVLTQIAGLDALQNLQKFELMNCSCLKKLNILSGLVRLEAIVVSYCGSLTKMPDLGGLMCLDSLELCENRSMNEVGCLSSALKHVSVVFAISLKKMPDVSGLTCLETLELLRNDEIEEVGGVCLSSTLKCLTISRCPKLRRLPSLNDCVHLQTLTIEGPCQALRNAGLRRLASLQVLQLVGGDWSSDYLNEQFKHLTSLQSLSIQNYSPIEQLQVESLSSLKRLEVRKCGALREMGDLSRLQCLEEVMIKQCTRLELKKVSGLVGISTHLKRLDLDCRLSTQLKNSLDLDGNGAGTC